GVERRQQGPARLGGHHRGRRLRDRMRPTLFLRPAADPEGRDRRVGPRGGYPLRVVGRRPSQTNRVLVARCPDPVLPDRGRARRQADPPSRGRRAVRPAAPDRRVQGLRRILVSAALAVVAALVAAGCGGGSKSSNAASTATTATATFDPKAALITLGDLPAGWAAVPTASDRGTFCGKAASAQALAKTAAEYAEGGAIPILQHAVGAYSP